MPSMRLRRQILPLFLMVLSPVILVTKAVADTLPVSECASEPSQRVERALAIKRLPIVRAIVMKGEPVFDPSRETLGDEILAGLKLLHWQTRDKPHQQQADNHQAQCQRQLLFPQQTERRLSDCSGCRGKTALFDQLTPPTLKPRH